MIRGGKTTSLLLAASVAAATAMMATAPAEAVQCIRAGGKSTAAFEGFASLLSQAAMKNSAKAQLGETVRIAQPKTKCEFKGLLYECNSWARACK